VGLFDFLSPQGTIPEHVPAPDQDRELVLFKYDMCPFCVRVMRHARGLGLELTMKDTLQDPSARKELIEHTGRTQVPMLLIDGVPLLESADINTWLDAYSERAA